MYHQLLKAPCHRKWRGIGSANTLLTLVTPLAFRFPTVTRRHRRSTRALPETAPITLTRSSLQTRRVIPTSGSAQEPRHLQRMGSYARNSVRAATSRLLGTSLRLRPIHRLARLSRTERASNRGTLWRTSGRRRLGHMSLNLCNHGGRQRRPRDPCGRSRRRGLSG